MSLAYICSIDSEKQINHGQQAQSAWIMLKTTLPLRLYLAWHFCWWRRCNFLSQHSAHIYFKLTPLKMCNVFSDVSFTHIIYMFNYIYIYISQEREKKILCAHLSIATKKKKKTIMIIVEQTCCWVKNHCTHHVVNLYVSKSSPLPSRFYSFHFLFRSSIVAKMSVNSI